MVTYDFRGGRVMAEKLYRVRMRETRYFYIDTKAEDEDEAIDKVERGNFEDKDWTPEEEEKDIFWEQSDTYELGGDDD